MGVADLVKEGGRRYLPRGSRGGGGGGSSSPPYVSADNVASGYNVSGGGGGGSSAPAYQSADSVAGGHTPRSTSRSSAPASSGVHSTVNIMPIVRSISDPAARSLAPDAVKAGIDSEINPSVLLAIAGEQTDFGRKGQGKGYTGVSGPDAGPKESIQDAAAYLSKAGYKQNPKKAVASLAGNKAAARQVMKRAAGYRPLDDAARKIAAAPGNTRVNGVGVVKDVRARGEARQANVAKQLGQAAMGVAANVGMAMGMEEDGVANLVEQRQIAGRERQMQARSDRLWSKAKEVSGLKGPAPKVKVTDKPIDALAFVRGGRNTVKIPRENANQKGDQLLNTLLHEFAHTDQTKRTRNASDAQGEGQAERFRMIVGRKLGLTPDQASAAYREYQKAAQGRSKGFILEGQFGGRNKVSGKDARRIQGRDMGAGMEEAMAARLLTAGAGRGGQKSSKAATLSAREKQLIAGDSKLSGGGSTKGMNARRNAQGAALAAARGENPKIQGPLEKRVAQRLAKAVAKGGSVDVKEFAALGPDAAELAEWSVKYGKKYGIPPSVLFNQQGIESGWGTDIVGPPTSYGNARGWTQFIPPTRDQIIADHGVDPWKSPKDAVHAQALYLTDLGFQNDPEGAVFGYNHSDAYVSDVLSGAAQYKSLDNASVGKSKLSRPLMQKANEVLGGKVTKRIINGGDEGPIKGADIGKLRGPKDQINAFKMALKTAQRIDAADIPYLMDHSNAIGKIPGVKAEYLDCSSFVSKILQKIGTPGFEGGARVSGDMGNAEGLAPGPGAITVYYNDGHTFMQIGNKFFGTSREMRTDDAANGGPVQLTTPSAEYLSSFNVAHVANLKDLKGAKVATKGLALAPDGTTAALTASNPVAAPGATSLPPTPAGALGPQDREQIQNMGAAITPIQSPVAAKARESLAMAGPASARDADESEDPLIAAFRPKRRTRS